MTARCQALISYTGKQDLNPEGTAFASGAFFRLQGRRFHRPEQRQPLAAGSGPCGRLSKALQEYFKFLRTVECGCAG